MKPRPNSFAALDALYQLHPYTNARRNESEGGHIMVKGKGIFVYDEEGKEYIEGMAGLWSASLGFSEDRLIEAAIRQMRQLPFYHGFSGKGSDIAAQLSQRLIDMAPGPFSKIFFVNSGSEAVDTAMKMVWYYQNAIGNPRKKKIISRMKAYHGVTIAAASLTGRAGNHQDFDLPLPGILHTDCPHYYRFAEPGESEEEFSQRLADNLEALILREGPETIAAFIAEPVQGSGGVLIPPSGYFPRIQSLLQKYDILFLVDEVICGFGRTGYRWGSQAFDLKPDIITIAKQLSASYMPIAGLLINERVYGPLADNSAKHGNFGHGFTFGGHPVACAVALETLNIYQSDRIEERVQMLAPLLQTHLQAFADHPLVGEVRAIGLMGAIEFVQNKGNKTPFPADYLLGPQAVAFCREEGLIVRNAGDSLCFCPPMIISEDELTEMFNRFAKALKKLEEWLEKRVHEL